MVDWYAATDAISGMLVLNPATIPESDLNTLAALLMAEEPMRCSEANGADNPEWEKSMEPALIRIMQQPRDKYVMEEFHDIWTSGVRSYFMGDIEYLVNERLEELNEDRECHTRMVWNYATERACEVSA